MLWPSIAVAAILSFTVVLGGRQSDGLPVDPLEPAKPFWGYLPIVLLPLCVALAVLIGVMRLRQEWAAPERYWHWLPIVGMGVAVVASPLTICGTRWRIIGWLLVGAAAAFWLVPTWETLSPSRSFYIVMLGCYFAVLTSLYLLVAKHTAVDQLLVSLIACGVAVAVAVAATASLKYGQLALLVAVSLAGCLPSCWLVQLKPTLAAALMPTAACLIGGAAFVGYVYPDPPLYELLVLPWAPVAMLASRDRRTGTLTRFAALLLALATVVVILLLRTR